MAKATTKTTTAKSTAKTTAVISTTIALNNGVSAINNAVEAIKKAESIITTGIEAASGQLVNLVRELSEKEMLHEARIAELTAEYEVEKARLDSEHEDTMIHYNNKELETAKNLDEKLRVAKFELELAIKQNELNTLNNLAAKHTMTLMDTKTAEALTKDRDTIVKEATDQVVKDYYIEKARMEREYKSQIIESNYKHEAETAKLVSSNESLTAQLDSARKETERIQKQFDDLREAMVKMTQAQATSSVTIVNDGNKK
jgi:hypothetical protein